MAINPSLRKTRVALVVVIASHLILSLLYSLNTPLWAAPDENGHYAYARYLAQHKALPRMSGTEGYKPLVPSHDELTQPPLYYGLVALPMMFVDSSDDAQATFAAGGTTWVIPNREIDQFPYQGTALALRLGRLVSILIGTASVLLTYLITRAAFPNQPALSFVATAFHAWLPSFLFLNGAINNDIGAAFMGSLTLLIAVQLYQRLAKASAQHNLASRQIGLWAAALACCGLLSIAVKIYGVAHFIFCLLLIHALALKFMLKPQKHGRHVSLRLLLGFWLPILIGGLSIYAIAPNMIASLLFRITRITIGAHGLQLFAQTWFLSFASFFASFDWGAVVLPLIWYQAAFGALLLCGIGYLLALVKRQWLAMWVISALMMGCVWLGTIIWLGRGVINPDEAPPYLAGRAFFSCLSAVCISVAIAIAALPHWLRRLAGAYLLGGMGAAALLSLPLSITPAYKPVGYTSLEQVRGEIQNRSTLVFANAIRLLGYSNPTVVERISRDPCVQVTFYWHILQEQRTKPSYGLQIVTFWQNTQIGNLLVSPGNNTLRSQDLQPGRVLKETLCVPMTTASANRLPIGTVTSVGVKWVTYDETRSRLDQPAYVTLPYKAD
ncbi:MAG: hypothetical protein KIH69_023215 [Anaerolineae bacterium]|nr:hypothetical protein [Anaerolineae bacterium]